MMHLAQNCVICLNGLHSKIVYLIAVISKNIHNSLFFYTGYAKFMATHILTCFSNKNEEN